MRKMNWKKTLAKLAKQKRAMVGLEAAIILIAFVIIAGAFSFMVINQGLFATERGKTVVQEGLKQASTPLCVDGSIFLKTNKEGSGIEAMVIPLRAYGVKYVAMGSNETVISLKLGQYAWPNVYNGLDTTDPTNKTLTQLYTEVTSANTTELFIQNNNAASDTSLDSDEKGYLVFNLNWTGHHPTPRTHIVVEIRPEKAAPLTIDFYVPESLPQDEWITVGG
ncbi:MAG: archaellin/type IV pilin N-terminal domain-containing protein [Candidatus Bathyarchaeia archaeon]